MYKLDLFGTVVGLSYKNGKTYYRSTFGGILFIFTSLISIGVFAFYFTKFMARDLPYMNSILEKYSNPPHIDTSNFKFAIMTQYFSENIFNHDVFDLKVSHIIKKNGREIKTHLQLINCTDDMFPEAKVEFKNLELSKGLCVDTNNTFLEGSNLSDLFAYISIEFLMCLNKSYCMESSKLSSFIAESLPLAVVYLYDTVFQTTNKYKLTNKFINNFDVRMTFNNVKTSNIYLSENFINVEKGFFLEKNLEVHNGIVFDSFRDSVSVRAGYQNNSLSINLMTSKTSSRINISYMQLSELIANVGAIVGNIYHLAFFLSRFFNQMFYELDLIEDLVMFKEIKGVNKYVKVKPVQASSLGILVKSDLEKNHFKNSQKTRIQSVRKNKIYISKYQYLNYFVCKCKKNLKNKQIKFLREKLLSMFNYQFIYSRLQEIEFMKYLIFNETQLKCFKFLKKPELLYPFTVPNPKTFTNFYFDSNINKPNAKTLINKIKMQNGLSDVDLKILEELENHEGLYKK
jgi:hypothetical protein